MMIARDLWIGIVGGAPALLATLGVVGLSIAGFNRRTTLEVRYADEGELALEEKRFGHAEMCFERLLDLGTDKPKAQFGLARTYYAKDDKPRAMALVQQLAPPNTKGYGPAHRWLGDYLLSQAKASPTFELSAFAHYQHALEDDPNSPDTHRRLLVMLQRQGDYARAERHIAELERLNSLDLYVKAHFYWQWSNRLGTTEPGQAQLLRQRALDQIGAAVSGLEHNVARSPDDHGTRLKLASIYAIQKKYAESEILLVEGRKRSDLPAYREALGNVYLAWSNSLAEDEAASSKRLALLLRALQLVPNSPHAYSQLAELGELEGEAALQARTALQQKLVDHPQPALIHLLLAQLAWNRSDEAQALFHMERAQQIESPLAPAVINNLAYYLAHKSEPDYPKALALIEPLVAKYPKELRFLDTRGRVYAKLRRDKEALMDLEKAAPAVRDKHSLYLALSGIYERLGMGEQAMEYAKAAAAAKRKPKR